MMVGDDLITVLGNKYNTEILTATDEPMSAKQLSEELDVPIATCYRRIDELEEAELLELRDRPLSDEKRRTKRYCRLVDGIEVDFRDGFSLEVEERSNVKNRLEGAWQKLSSGQD